MASRALQMNIGRQRSSSDLREEKFLEASAASPERSFVSVLKELAAVHEQELDGLRKELAQAKETIEAMGAHVNSPGTMAEPDDEDDIQRTTRTKEGSLQDLLKNASVIPAIPKKPLGLSRGDKGFGVAPLGSSDASADQLTPTMANRWAYRIVKAPKFEWFTLGIILLNSIFIGASTQHQVSCAGMSCTGDVFFLAIEIVFVTWFSLEIALKMAAEGRYAFTGADRIWNFLDLCLAIISVVQLMIESAVPSLSVARNIRLLRVPRLLRIMKAVRSVSTLRVMVFSVVKAMDVLIWVFLVLLLFMYLFSMVFMFAASDHIANSGDRHAVVVQDFETVFESILTLYQCMTGGRDWQETYVGLAEVNTVFGLIFVGFLFFMEFLVINVVIGTVVTKTDEVSRKDKDLLVHYEMKNVREYTASIKKFFMAADADQSGQLSKEEFAQYLKDDRVKAYFQTLDLDVSQANALFDFLDRNESGEVGVQEFFDGCRRLKGAARSMDVHMALFYLEQVIEKLNKTMQASASIPVITESRKEDGKPLL